MAHMTPENEAAFLARLHPDQYEAYVYAFKRELARSPSAEYQQLARVDRNLRMLEELDNLMLTEDHLVSELDEWDWIREVYRDVMNPNGLTQPLSEALMHTEIVAKLEAMLVEVRNEIRKLVAQRPDWKQTMQSLANNESIGSIRRAVAVNILEAIEQPGILSDIVEKPRRDQLCPCGSHLKYKKCCGKDSE
ncbi:hypothetical protein VSDG_05982 [Cytospora chrysosperma]|uniref:Uncharacterized protein n=1 Tax=Cytospora chrysosperma TaxID=252740 RepID=A0A423VTT6_CYTCH|nr:hypothetical protein VSDG_05982 [Valsa sordida]